MATLPVTSRHLHLDLHRPLILERAAVAQAAALLPVPIVDDLLADAARATLLRKIAAARGVGADEAALAILSRIAVADDSFSGAAANQLTRRLLRRTFRRLAVALHVVGHAGDFATTVAVATLFDHYCVRHHVGPGLDAAAATRLRTLIDRAIGQARRDLAGSGVRRALGRTRQLLLAAPRALARRVPLLPAPGDAAPLDVEAVEPDARPSQAGATVLQRSMSAAGAAGRGWVEALVDAFDRLFAEAQAASPPPLPAPPSS